VFGSWAAKSLHRETLLGVLGAAPAVTAPEPG
jgi:hypothetical protein